MLETFSSLEVNQNSQNPERLGLSMGTQSFTSSRSNPSQLAWIPNPTRAPGLCLA